MLFWHTKLLYCFLGLMAFQPCTLAAGNLVASRYVEIDSQGINVEGSLQMRLKSSSLSLPHTKGIGLASGFVAIAVIALVWRAFESNGCADILFASAFGASVGSLLKTWRTLMAPDYWAKHTDLYLLSEQEGLRRLRWPHDASVAEQVIRGLLNPLYRGWVKAKIETGTHEIILEGDSEPW